jgi:hypothetical protein
LTVYDQYCPRCFAALSIEKRKASGLAKVEGKLSMDVFKEQLVSRKAFGFPRSAGGRAAMKVH